MSNEIRVIDDIIKGRREIEEHLRFYFGVNENIGRWFVYLKENETAAKDGIYRGSLTYHFIYNIFDDLNDLSRKLREKMKEEVEDGALVRADFIDKDAFIAGFISQQEIV